MTTNIIQDKVVVVHSEEVCIHNGNDALDLFMNLSYHTGHKRFAINESALDPDFFVLRTGIAGDILQKFSNYQWKLAIYGDFSSVPPGPLQDFIRESNQGKDIFFLPDVDAAVNKLLSL